MSLKNKFIEFEEDDFYFEYDPEEDLDWNYARNKFFVLKRADACWSSGIYSVKMDGFLFPNRDYPYQGLLGSFKDSYFKFIDAIGFKLEVNDYEVNLVPTRVKVSPWKAIFFYGCEGFELKVEYFLCELGHKNRTGGWIKFTLNKNEEDATARLKILPLIDIRHVNSDSPAAEKYDVEHDDTLKISLDDKEVRIGTVEEFQPILENIEWRYKLGNGEREETEAGIKFVEHVKHPCKVGVIDVGELKDEPVTLSMVCGKKTSDIDLMEIKGTTMEPDLDHAEKLLKKFKIKNDKLHFYRKMRALTLNLFGKTENNVVLPEAGEWWFKEVWFRDLFESILHNFEYYYEIKDDEWFLKVFNWAALHVKDGVMANKPDKEDVNYNSLDATMLYLLVLNKYYNETKKKGNKTKVKQIYRKIMDQFDSKEDLLNCPANYSWIDSKISGDPARVPSGWDVDPRSDKFYLPEVNAMWVKVLEIYNNLFDEDIDIDVLVEEYKEMFWNEENDYIFQLVYQDGDVILKDATESSVGVVSLDYLFDYFDEEQLNRAWKQVARTLLVNRKPVLLRDRRMMFGITTMNSDEKVFYNDEQYHETTVWLRDNPYLCQFLEKLDKHSFVEQIKKNMLDHQMSEGAIFYNHELFSLPLGKNPTPTIDAMNPVPVKNPIQLWSHWVPALDSSVK